MTLIHNHITIYNTFRRSWKIYTFKISPLLSASFFQLNIQIQKTQLDNPLCIKSRVAEWKNGSQYMCADRSCYNRNFKQGLPYMWSRCENEMLLIVITFYYVGFQWCNTHRQMKNGLKMKVRKSILSTIIFKPFFIGCADVYCIIESHRNNM